MLMRALEPKLQSSADVVLKNLPVIKQKEVKKKKKKESKKK